MGLYVYHYSRHNVVGKFSYNNLEDAVNDAVLDCEFGRAWPKYIERDGIIVKTHKEIEAIWIGRARKGNYE